MDVQAPPQLACFTCSHSRGRAVRGRVGMAAENKMSVAAALADLDLHGVRLHGEATINSSGLHGVGTIFTPLDPPPMGCLGDLRLVSRLNCRPLQVFQQHWGQKSQRNRSVVGEAAGFLISELRVDHPNRISCQAPLDQEGGTFTSKTIRKGGTWTLWERVATSV